MLKTKIRLISKYDSVRHGNIALYILTVLPGVMISDGDGATRCF